MPNLFCFCGLNPGFSKGPTCGYGGFMASVSKQWQILSTSNKYPKIGKLVGFKFQNRNHNSAFYYCWN